MKSVDCNGNGFIWVAPYVTKGLIEMVVVQPLQRIIKEFTLDWCLRIRIWKQPDKTYVATIRR